MNDGATRAPDGDARVKECSPALLATENRRRFTVARKSLGWSLSRSALLFEVDRKLLEGWLYDRHRDVPRLAVLLIEAHAKIAEISGVYICNSDNARRNFRCSEKDSPKLIEAINLVVNGESVRQAAIKTGANERSISRRVGDIISARKESVLAKYQTRWSKGLPDKRQIAIEAVQKYGTYSAGVRASGLSYSSVRRMCSAANVRNTQLSVEGDE